MNPGYKVICVDTGSILLADSDTLEPTPELTLGKIYTVQNLLAKETTGFSVDRIILVEGTGQGQSAYSVQRFELYGM